MGIWNVIGNAAVLVYVLVTVFFLAAWARRKNDVADFAWGFGLIFVAVSTLVANPAPTLRGVLATSLVIIWGLRLSLYIYERNKGREDFRYNFSFIRSYFQLFLLQGFLLLLVSLPVIVINVSAGPELYWLDILGFLIWMMGFVFEVAGDYQLASFRRDPANRGKILTTGLWRYSRHPNYFGEITQWWGIFLIAIAAPYWWLSLLGPLTITIMILKISGVPKVEGKYKDSPEFEKYKEKTSVLIPKPPRSSQSQ